MAFPVRRGSAWSSSGTASSTCAWTTDLRPLTGAAFAHAPEILGAPELPTPEVLLDRLMRVSRNFDREPAVINHDDLPVREYSFRGFESDDAAVAGRRAERLWLEPWPVH
jgi:hypothetical protein